ncbi:hypothetical protein BWQ96_05968 [Gracilariopsis chorda]|uniref:Uncharacterized protein n=1 Tax=Gracilariopsis chorda TaxID=448386 RepID=A0A2V3IQC6_9FLOR|nr:hypothetical protein BWQ96_05968 [Gracilariopsis chorda]|eukprot:PXF44264.1 hypothetical protein BWQ96_05968 [Gracilariopsis chorda]
MRSRLPLMQAPLKSVESTGTLSELRKEHTHDAARSKRTKKVRLELQPEGRLRKTLFEIQREKYIAKRAHDAQESHPAISSPDSENQCSPGPSVKEPQRDAEESSSIEAEVDLEAQDLLRYALPSDVRSKNKQDMDVIYRQLLSSSEPSLRQTGAMGSDNKAFSSTEDYVDFWEPLLIAEYRVSVMKMIGEENLFAAQFKQDPHGYRYFPTAFEVQEPPSSVGYFHHLSMQLCEGQGGEIKGSRGGFSSSQFSIFDAQHTDIVYFLIPPARCTVGESGDVTESIAFVAAKKVNQGVLILELRICFDDAIETAPGKGRRIQVSRLMSLTMFQRQIEALWLVPFLPDGLLWQILDPSKGYAVNDAEMIQSQPSRTASA